MVEKKKNNSFSKKKNNLSFEKKIFLTTDYLVLHYYVFKKFNFELVFLLKKHISLVIRFLKKSTVESFHLLAGYYNVIKSGNSLFFSFNVKALKKVIKNRLNLGLILKKTILPFFILGSKSILKTNKKKFKTNPIIKLFIKQRFYSNILSNNKALYLSTKNNNTALQLFKKDLLKSFNVKKFFKKFFKKFKNKRLFCVLGTNRFFFYFKGKCLKILKQKGYSK